MARLRDKRIQAAVRVDPAGKKRKIVSAEDYHEMLSRQQDHAEKIIDEMER